MTNTLFLIALAVTNGVAVSRKVELWPITERVVVEQCANCREGVYTMPSCCTCKTKDVPTGVYGIADPEIAKRYKDEKRKEAQRVRCRKAL